MADSESERLGFLFRQRGLYHRLWPAHGGAPGTPQSELTGRMRRAAPPRGGGARVGRGAGLAGEGEGERADTAPSPLPGPARTVLTRAKERACAASCRAASTPDPAAAASLATAPAVTEGLNTALKDGGGGGGSGTSGFLRAALRPGKAQRGQEGRRSLLDGVRFRQCRLVARGANEGRESARVGDRGSNLLETTGRIVARLIFFCCCFQQIHIECLLCARRNCRL